MIRYVTIYARHALIIAACVVLAVLARSRFLSKFDPLLGPFASSDLAMCFVSFFFRQDYEFLNLGTLTALKEVGRPCIRVFGAVCLRA